MQKSNDPQTKEQSYKYTHKKKQDSLYQSLAAAQQNEIHIFHQIRQGRVRFHENRSFQYS